ncbi:MAG: histidine phosphatase family protein [Sulfuritalea sp.]|nr:histidine phosphatase family protein [Sulfuritalea sp.]
MKEGDSILLPAHICVVRHGETDWNNAGILQGWTDVPINEQGRRQSYELVATYSLSGFSSVYSSPLIRALETARIVARSLRLAPPTCHDGLKERNFGVIQGIPKSELAELNPVLLQQILKRNPAISFEQGEEMDEFADRVLGAVRDIGEVNRGKRVLVITHGWTIDVITRHITGKPRSAILGMKRRNGECAWLTVDGDSIATL